MAYPLTGTPRSGAVYLDDSVPPILTITATRTWNPDQFALFRSRSAQITIDDSVPPFIRITGTRVWSGVTASIVNDWPAYGQGWPRIKQA